jgi:hypothetical protein
MPSQTATSAYLFCLDHQRVPPVIIIHLKYTKIKNVQNTHTFYFFLYISIPNSCDEPLAMTRISD